MACNSPIDGLLKQGYYVNLKTLIETTYANGGNRRVVLVAHSMGAPISLYFLTKYVTQEWKGTYIKAYITISGVWRGAVNALKAVLSGQNEGIVFDLPIWGRAAQRTYPGISFLLPTPSDTWTNDTVLVTTPRKNYTAWDYKALFDDIGYPRGYDMFLEFGMLTSDLIPPNVTTYVYYGYQYPTPDRLVYTVGEFPDTEPILIMGDGDGTVNINSLLSCQRWKKQMPYNLTMVGFLDVEHVDAIKNDDVIKHVDDVVCNLKG